RKCVLQDAGRAIVAVPELPDLRLVTGRGDERDLRLRAGRDPTTGFALAAGVVGIAARIQAGSRRGERIGKRGLADSLRTDEEIRTGKLVRRQRSLQRPHRLIEAEQTVEPDSGVIPHPSSFFLVPLTSPSECRGSRCRP